MKNLSVLAMSVLFAVSAHASLEFSKSVAPELKTAFTNDMMALAESRIPGDVTLQRLIGADGTDGLSLLNWIDNRVNYIVADGFAVQSNLVVIKRQTYENPELPNVQVGKTTDGSGGVMTIMSNIGGGMYLAGKMQSILIGAKVDGKTIEITSPRTGILMVGPGLTQSATVNSAPSPKAAQYFRQAVLMHEARHSDGRGKSLAFTHAICPSGKYEGYNACDTSANGPYTVGAQFLKMVATQCPDCTPADKEWLQKASLDSFARIVAPQSQSTLDEETRNTLTKSYEMLLDICTRAKNCTPAQIAEYKAKLAEVRGPVAPPPTVSAPIVDATPEGVYKTVSRDETWKTISKLKAKSK